MVCYVDDDDDDDGDDDDVKNGENVLDEADQTTKGDHVTTHWKTMTTSIESTTIGLCSLLILKFAIKYKKPSIGFLY